MAQKFKIKKGDQVIVTTGRDKGRRGEVIEVLRSEGLKKARRRPEEGLKMYGNRPY